jgi:hypothetical protein
MRAFLIAFICLSTLAMAQNVVVATPLPRGDEGGSDSTRVDAATSDHSGAVATIAPREAPDPATMGLLVVGLSGLCAVGNRRSAPRRRQTA